MESLNLQCTEQELLKYTITDSIAEIIVAGSMPYEKFLRYVCFRKWIKLNEKKFELQQIVSSKKD